MRKIHIPEHLIVEVFEKEAELAMFSGIQSDQGSLEEKSNDGGGI